VASSQLRNNRDFRLLWGGEALSQLGSQASTVAFPLLVLALTGSAAKAGVVGLAKWLPLVVMALPAGVLADRFDRKRLMIGTDLIRALLLATIPLALALGTPTFLQVAAVAFLDGCLFTVRYVCERGALAHVVPQEQVPHAVAQNEARTFAANVVGPPLGGLLFAVARALPFVADAVSYLASMVSVALTRARFQDPREAHQRATGRLGGVSQGLGWLWRHPFFRSSALLFAVGNPLYSGLYLLAILLAKRHGASSAAVGAMFAVVGIGGVLGAMVAGRLRAAISPRAALVGEAWLLAAVIPLLFAAHAALLIGLIVAACELPTPLANSLVSGHRVALTPDHLRGRVQAAGTLVTMSLAWLGPLAVGVAYQHAGANTTIALVTAWALSLAAATTFTPALYHGPPRLERRNTATATQALTK
jgi:predicted MFS family arabinose efflux permease